LINQQNEYYTSLRREANVEGDQMAQAFQQSHEAYAGGDGALAKHLSDQGKEHKKKMEDLNKRASDWIFAGTSRRLPPRRSQLLTPVAAACRVPH
jgi:Domain of unknown function (DUF1771)